MHQRIDHISTVEMGSLSLLLLLAILSLSTSTTTAASDILLGSTLYASNPNQAWTSPNKQYSLSFITDGVYHFAAITYSGIPIWKAGGDPGGAADSSFTFSLTSDGNLQLISGSTGAIVWQSNTANRGVSSAILDNSGNFILKNGTGSIWTTFDHPTDALLPNQNFTVDQVLRSGLYSFRLLSSGNLSLQWNDSIMYHTSSGVMNLSIHANLRNPYLNLQSNGTLLLFDTMLISPHVVAYASDHGEGNDIFRFLKLDNDGNLRIYGFVGVNGTEQAVRWSAVEDQCQVFGYCGDMGVCSYVNFKAVCGCPSENFYPVDPGNGRKGCKRKVEIEDCSGSMEMLQLNNAIFLTYPPELSSESYTMSFAACRANCLVGDSCIASTSLSDGRGFCIMKVPGFVSAHQSPELPDTSFVKVCGPVQPYPSDYSLVDGKDNGWELHPWVLPILVAGILCGLIVLEGGFWWCCCRNRPTLGQNSAKHALLQYASSVLFQFSLKELQNATGKFKEKIGEGAFGDVYRGVLANGTACAVKKLEGICQGEKQFRMVVATVSSTHHFNLVKLIGFCSEKRNRFLVHDLIKNGSLDKFLFPSEQKAEKLLNWETRFRIALGTARGITYLHEECQNPIVHFNMKPENILLDEYYNAKVSDFGLAELGNEKRREMCVRGTRGYLAPEWHADLPITSKSDVYSYGMVLLEIVSGRRNFEVSSETNRTRLSVWAYEEFSKGNIEVIIDERLHNHELDMEEVIRAIQVSFCCLHDQPSQRPNMGKVVQMLEGVIKINRPPEHIPIA